MRRDYGDDDVRPPHPFEMINVYGGRHLPPVIRRLVNVYYYLKLMRRMTDEDVGTFRYHLRVRGFNRAVEHLVFVKSLEDERQRDELKRTLKRTVERRRAEEERRRYEEQCRAAIRADEELKRRREEGERLWMEELCRRKGWSSYMTFRDPDLDWRPSVGELDRYPVEFQTWPYAGIELKVYEASDHRVYVGVIRIMSPADRDQRPKVIIGRSFLRVVTELKERGDELGRALGLRLSKDPFRKPSWVDPTRGFDLDRIRRNMGLEGDDDDGRFDVF